MLLLQRKPKPGCAKPSLGPHAAHGLDIPDLKESVWSS